MRISCPRFCHWLPASHPMSWGGLVGITILRDDTEMAVQKLLSLTIVDFAAIALGISLLHMTRGFWQDAIEWLPARWNPVKRRAFRNLTPAMINQFNIGRYFTGGLVAGPIDASFIVELGRLRTELDNLDIKYPIAGPLDFPEWDWWIGFLEALLPLATDGNLEAARNLSRKSEVDNQPDP